MRVLKICLWIVAFACLLSVSDADKIHKLFIRENLVGEEHKDTLKIDFHCRLKLEFHGTKVTSDAGLLVYQELDNVLDLTTVAVCQNSRKKPFHDVSNAFWVFFCEMAY